MRIVLSAIYGDYDTPIPQVEQTVKVDKWILFTDNPDLKSDFWQVIYFPLPYDHPRNNAKYIRMFGYTILPQFIEYEKDNEIIWIDGALVLQKEVVEWISSYSGFLVLQKHPGRNCIYEEIKASQQVPSKYGSCDFDSQAAYYRKLGIKPNSGLLGTCIMLMRPCPSLDKLMNYWWAHNLVFNYQDQVTLPAAILQSKVTPTTIEFNPIYHHNRHKSNL